MKLRCVLKYKQSCQVLINNKTNLKLIIDTYNIQDIFPGILENDVNINIVQSYFNDNARKMVKQVLIKKKKKKHFGFACCNKMIYFV